MCPSGDRRSASQESQPFCIYRGGTAGNAALFVRDCVPWCFLTPRDSMTRSMRCQIDFFALARRGLGTVGFGCFNQGEPRQPGQGSPGGRQHSNGCMRVNHESLYLLLTLSFLIWHRSRILCNLIILMLSVCFPPQSFK